MVDYIIVQAGGKGTRLHHLTKNKPKALVPVHNLPMIFHLFEKYPKKNFIIIADYKRDVLKKYLQAFARVKYLIAETDRTGTCSGIQKALSYIPEHKSFMLLWSDLILPENFLLPQTEGNYIGLSHGFSCRWKYENNRFEEQPSKTAGVAGLFIFKEKSLLMDVPESGEFVRWLQKEKKTFKEIPLNGTKEYGTMDAYETIQSGRCRPFNRIYVKEDRIMKEGINAQGKKLAVREKNWYQHVIGKGFNNIPHIFSYEPLEMEKVSGKNIFEYDLSLTDKKMVLKNIITCLKKLHRMEKAPTDYFSMQEAYFSKTRMRLNTVRDMIPFSHQQSIVINGRECRNVYFFFDELEQMLSGLNTESFVLLHGDCTFSNILLRENQEPVLIDPRGYFGYTEMYGDANYDWAKLYYSLKGNYDQFNLRHFSLDISRGEVNLSIVSNHWEETEADFWNYLDGETNPNDIKLIHAIIWLSLTTYAWEDYDSICGAFYNGLYYLEEILEK